jgi:NAD(P)-dependent dehydrogenase (short-subunit alcohol dehydrogenase family)
MASKAVTDINKIASSGGKADYIVANVNVRNFYGAIYRANESMHQSKAGCNALIAEYRKRENNLDVLVNNSGISWGGPYNDFPEEKGWDNVFNVNVKSVFYSTLNVLLAF